MLPVLLLVFATAFFMVLAACAHRGRTAGLARMLRRHDVAPLEIARDPEEIARRERVQERVVSLVAQLGGARRRRAQQRAYRSVHARLVQAGFRRPSALPVYMGSRILLSIALGVGVLLHPATWLLDDVALLLALGAAAGFGFVAPGLFVDVVRARRQRRIQQALPDAIDLMVVCLEAGLSLTAALTRVASEFSITSPVLASEFKLVVLETRAGKSHADALRGLSERTGLSEVRAFVSTLIQTERFGTDLADTFRVHSESLRNRRLLAAEEVAQKAPVKMLVPAALFIFPATLIVTVGPGVLNILSVFE